MKQSKLLSICMPTYNREFLMKRQLFFLQKQIANLSEAMQQLLEVIVSVNPSQDNTEAYIRKQHSDSIYKYYINETNIGGMPNINAAIQRACGKYIWVVSDDDIIIEGLISKVLCKLSQNEDISWFFINFAGLNGSSADPQADIEFYKNSLPYEGYCRNGKQTVTDMLKKVDGGILFCTANIFLREAAANILLEYPLTNNAADLLAYILYSATLGSAYIEKDSYVILGGGVTSWADKKYQVAVHDFNDALLRLKYYGFDEKEIRHLIRYRMRHKALIVWFYIFRAMIITPSKGFKSYFKYLRYIPAETIIMTIFAPIVAIYLLLRHHRHIVEHRKLVNNNGGKVSAYWKRIWEEYPKLI